MGRQGKEVEQQQQQLGGAQIQHLDISPPLACRGHPVIPFPSHPGHKICF